MATLREIVYDISEIVNAYSDDTKISEEHIAFMVNNKRNLLLKQYMSDMKKEIPQEAIQTICLSLSPDETCLENEIVLKSDQKMPSTLDNTGRGNMIKAYGKDSKFLKNINVIDYSRLPFVSSEKYNKSMLFVTTDNKKYLNVYNPDNRHILLENLEVEGVFENPEEAYNLSCEADSDTDFYDTKYPVESALVDIIRRDIVQELLLKYKIPVDEINNGEDNINTRTTQNSRR